ncbi:MAG: hypothetical protein KDH09_04085 [Chrysiogenetes bacterium]|nr:hypothetical protein [Chrysiogenetes bacterium]
MKISRQGALAGGLIFLALIAGPILGAAQEADRTGGALVEQTEKGLINWSAGYVEAEGAGAVSEEAPTAVVARLGAQRAAKADAYRNLLETVQGVRVQGETVVENFMTVSDTIHTRVSGIVRGASEVESHFDGQVATTRLRMPLWGELASAVMERPAGLTPSYTPFPAGSGNPGNGSGEGRPGGGMRGMLERGGALLRRFARLLAPVLSPGAALAGENNDPGRPALGEGALQVEVKNSGLIIDLTKTRIKPDLFPVIVDAASGKTIVDARAAGSEKAAAGAVGFAASVEEARSQTERVGADPLLVQALNLAAGTTEGWTVDFATGMGLETAKGLATKPADILKQGVSVAYRISW